jgi:hypothetical protein
MPVFLPLSNQNTNCHCTPACMVKNNPKQRFFVFVIALPIQKMMEISRSIMSQFHTNFKLTLNAPGLHTLAISRPVSQSVGQPVSQSHLSCYDTSMFITVFTKGHTSPLCPKLQNLILHYPLLGKQLSQKPPPLFFS